MRIVERLGYREKNQLVNFGILKVPDTLDTAFHDFLVLVLADFLLETLNSTLDTHCPRYRGVLIPFPVTATSLAINELPCEIVMELVEIYTF